MPAARGRPRSGVSPGTSSPAATPRSPFRRICQTGLATLPDIIAESSINLEDTRRVADQYKGLICGIKARMVSPALEIMGMEMPRLAKRAARESGINLMVHIGDTEKR